MEQVGLHPDIINKFRSISERTGVPIEVIMDIAFKTFFVIDSELANGAICQLKRSNDTILTLDIDSRLYPNSTLKETNAEEPIDIRSIRVGTIFIMYDKYYLAFEETRIVTDHDKHGFKCIYLGTNNKSLVPSIQHPYAQMNMGVLKTVNWFADSLSRLKYKDIIAQLTGPHHLAEQYANWLEIESLKDSVD